MSLGWDTTALVLNSGQVYVIYSKGGVIQDMVDGTTTVNAGSLSSTNALDFTPLPLTRASATISATYSAQQSLNGTVTQTSGEFSHTDTFATTYQAAYDTTPTLTSLAGSYSGSGATRSGTGSLSLTVDATGQVSGTLSAGADVCTLAGSISASGNGKAIQGARLNLSGTACSLNGSAVEGAVALLPASAGTGSTLYLSALLLDRSNGVVAQLNKL
ncbi:hypothetical protein [Burkholderia cenocepacia]|uniref:hypothetical protein n=1 Tax=Burkholderia cenocepacia TaxID=95486 RepID=UPI00076CAA75|nr:hypothetical protein [Burkholderia cenocepacia]KWU19141.1 hypothetical protein AS149_12905 [Burkholderia cenocepacia]